MIFTTNEWNTTMVVVVVVLAHLPLLLLFRLLLLLLFRFHCCRSCNLHPLGYESIEVVSDLNNLILRSTFSLYIQSRVMFVLVAVIVVDNNMKATEEKWVKAKGAWLPL